MKYKNIYNISHKQKLINEIKIIEKELLDFDKKWDDFMSQVNKGIVDRNMASSLIQEHNKKVQTLWIIRDSLQ